jgi:hypothetical protein
MAHKIGPAAWNLNSKPELTTEAITAKSRDIARAYQDLFLNYAQAVNHLAATGDVLGLQCFSVATKQLLADAVAMCADTLTVRLRLRLAPKSSPVLRQETGILRVVEAEAVAVAAEDVLLPH